MLAYMYCVFVSERVHRYICEYLYVSVCVYVCAYVCVCVCVCVCVYVFVFFNEHTTVFFAFPPPLISVGISFRCA